LEEIQMERDWYDAEEFGGTGFGATAGGHASNPFIGDDDLFKKREAEMQQRMRRRDGT
jgi:pre-mRNA-splicing factor ATP-dependent RNA helicase DHX38/PRP16